MKDKPKIEIKPENKGKFTDYCVRSGFDSVTDSCIQQGLNSKSAKVRARAQFAANAKEWSR